MSLFTPKYPPGAEPPKREARGARKAREETNAQKAAMERRFKDARRASKERGAAFWEDYERRNGPGSVDWSA